MTAVEVDEFEQLHFVSQLMLWTMRHQIYAAEMNRPMSRRVEQTYRVAGLPQGVGVVRDLLAQLSRTASDPIVFNVPAGQRLMPHENHLSQCMERQIGRSPRCPREPLQELVPTTNHASLLRKFALLADILFSIQTVSFAPRPSDRPLCDGFGTGSIVEGLPY